jgi:hypothetical protein
MGVGIVGLINGERLLNGYRQPYYNRGAGAGSAVNLKTATMQADDGINYAHA